MLSQQHISTQTPTGATLRADGATVRVWAPEATAVYLHGIFRGQVFSQFADDRLLRKDQRGYWTGYQDGARDGDRYRFWVQGVGSSGYKRDPYARELDPAGFPNCFCILRAADGFPWHDQDFVTPDFSEMIVYQLHVGTFAIRNPGVASNFLDVALKIPYLADLGINVLQPLPVDEQEANPNMGYSGADLFSPDFPYIAVENLPFYLEKLNQLYAAKQRSAITLADIQSGPGQLKALVDLCHLSGIAVVFDVVYNHAGGFSADGQFDDNCLYYMDRRANRGNNNDSLYFTDQDRGTGGLAFALWNDDVSKFLLDNARYYLEEFHADGFRYDEISTLISTSQGSGWQFCRALTSSLRGFRNRILQNAEFWAGRFPDIPASAAPVVAPAAAGGMGFDVVQHDYLRGVLRGAVGAASGGAGATVPVSAIAAALYPPGFDHGWRAVTCVENHDLVLAGRDPRLPTLADPSNHRSWYARSRSRVATAILLTAPGIPQIFMGQEFLEDKPWDVDPRGPNLLSWNGLDLPSDSSMRDHLRFTKDLVHLRRDLPALRSDNVHAFYQSDNDRVIAYHRWREGTGDDVIVVASFAETTWTGYKIGFPRPGLWKERFNSDVYDHWVNPQVAGNGGGVVAEERGLHGFTASAPIVIPANGVVVFVKG
ncbi:MAG TPA: alpha amylase C-terminal domain-containing protein [Bradyrhizobium sp.]|nr:alpha amylase C-terminal domain-containing protein [Bradyrhizobium sp.]